MDSRVGVAVFGFGRIGRVHMRSLIECRRAQVLYIIEEFDDATRKEIAGPEWNMVVDHGTQVIKPKDAEKALSDKRVKAVAVCVPTRLHESVIELACKHKKDIFCEKPVSGTVEGTAKSYSLAKSANVNLFCALNRRFDPALVKIQKSFAAGDIGKAKFINACGRDHPESPDDYFDAGAGSMFLDMGIHIFDLLPWMVGEYPNQVTAMGHAHKEAYRKRGDYDVIAWMLKFPSGLIATVDGTRYAPYGYDNRFEIIGTKGAFVAENERDDELITRTEEGDLITPIQHSFPIRYKKSYYAEMVHFLDIVEGKAECSVSAQSAINGIKAAMAAEQACKTGQVVTITY